MKKHLFFLSLFSLSIVVLMSLAPIRFSQAQVDQFYPILLENRLPYSATTPSKEPLPLKSCHQMTGAALSTTSPKNPSVFMYLSGYMTGTASEAWYGTLQGKIIKNPAYSAPPTHTENASEASSASSLLTKIAASEPLSTWHAGPLLDRRDPASRKIFTLRHDGQGALFMWHSSAVSSATTNGIDAEQKQALNLHPKTGKPDGLGFKRLNYIRGDRTLETNSKNPQSPAPHTEFFRKRNKILGSIVHSVPVYAGSPSTNLRRLHDATYEDFLRQYSHRPPALYIAANDGMLHAFDAHSGKELFAYIPRALFPRLNQLTWCPPKNATQRIQENAFVDATPAIHEAQLQQGWKSVLVSGPGGGAAGVFALDVTAPEAFGSAHVLWEFTEQDDPAMGHVLSAPQIVKLQIDETWYGKPKYKWFALVSSGIQQQNQQKQATKSSSNNSPHNSPYNAPLSASFSPINKANSANSATKSISNQAAFFILSLEKPPQEPWREGDNYYKISLPKQAYGLSQASVVLGAAQEAQYAYAGDLAGNIWKLNLTFDAQNTGLSQAHPPWSLSRLFIATDDEGKRQPITVPPTIVFSDQGYQVLFGTGQWLAPRWGTTQTQSFYAVADKLNDSTIHRKNLSKHLAFPSQDPAAPGAYFVDSSIENDNVNQDSGEFMAIDSNPGWYFDFPETGERQIAPAELIADRIILKTFLPTDHPISDAIDCSDGKLYAGLSRSYVIHTLTGLSTATQGNALSRHLFSKPLLVNQAQKAPNDNAEAHYDGARHLRLKKQYSLINPDNPNTQEQLESPDATPEPLKPYKRPTTFSVAIEAGRMSWREIPDWRELLQP